MAEASITLKLTPSEYELLMQGLQAGIDLNESIRQTQTDPRDRTLAREKSARFQDLRAKLTR